MPSEKLTFDYPSPKTLRLDLSGDWQLTAGLPEASQVFLQLDTRKDITLISFNIIEPFNWDSGFISFLRILKKECESRGITVDTGSLPEGIRKLLSFASKIEHKEVVRTPEHVSFLENAADIVLRLSSSGIILLNFLGDLVFSFWRLVTGRAYFRKDEFMGIVQKCGADALPLVSLISVLVGMILAFIGAMQLKLFGAQIFIADIVGIAMVRVMGAVMTGILMAGRTGASFAAELGLMQVNEEIDALKTLGVSPVEFLVMPRVLALVIMMPLLTLYSDFMGILGGFFISYTFLGLNPVEYWHHTQSAVKLSNLWVGLVHGFVFGIIVSVAGCFRGIRCERSAAALGEATTSAVVSAITSIVIATAVITFVCQVLGV